MTGKASADRRAHGRDFIFGLKCLHAEVFVTREFMQNVRRRRDWIRAVEQRPSRQLSGSDKPNRGSFVAGDFAITTGSDDGFLDRVMRGENFGRFRKVVSGLQRYFVGLYQFWILFELRVDPVQSWIEWPVIQPVEHAECEEVFAAIDLFA